MARPQVAGGGMASIYWG